MADNLPELEKIAKAAKNGDIDSFSDLYTATFERIYKFVYFRVGHKETAEDIAEDVFINAYSSIHKLEQPKIVLAWLYQIAKNKIIDHYRSKKSIDDLTVVEDSLRYSVAPVEIPESDFEQKRLMEALKQLPHEQREVLTLKFFEDLDFDEIAAIIGKSNGNVRVIQHRGIQKLTKLLGNV
ncbi:MAG TPA: RNA polymerase sigma factor [Patescibacteria group bacterium]|nr:RNA polymerase sigma factor [Patescibacteria group bacterium]